MNRIVQFIVFGICLGIGTTSSQAFSALAIDIVPAQKSMHVGQLLQLYAFFGDGALRDNISAQVTWSSDNTSIISIQADGLIEALAVGSANVNVSYGDITQLQFIQVFPAALTRIAIPVQHTITMQTDSSYQLIANGYLSNGKRSDVSNTVNWSVLNSDLAQITPQGVLHAQGSGYINVQAELDGFVANTYIQVIVVNNREKLQSSISFIKDVVDNDQAFVDVRIVASSAVPVLQWSVTTHHVSLQENVNWIDFPQQKNTQIEVVQLPLYGVIADGTEQLLLYLSVKDASGKISSNSSAKIRVIYDGINTGKLVPTLMQALRAQQGVILGKDIGKGVSIVFVSNNVDMTTVPRYWYQRILQNWNTTQQGLIPAATVEYQSSKLILQDNKLQKLAAQANTVVQLNTTVAGVASAVDDAWLTNSMSIVAAVVNTDCDLCAFQPVAVQPIYFRMVGGVAQAPQVWVSLPAAKTLNCQQHSCSADVIGAVAAAALTMVVQQTTLTLYDLKKILAVTADPVNGQNNTNAAGYTYSQIDGFGTINVNAAIQYAQSYVAASKQPVVVKSSKKITSKQANAANVLIDAVGATVASISVELAAEIVGAVEVKITSPSGTSYQLVVDANKQQRIVHQGFFGEIAFGYWKISLTSTTAAIHIPANILTVYAVR